MTKFEQFQEKFENYVNGMKYGKETFYDRMNWTDNNFPEINLELVANNCNIEYDSYGSEDSQLSYIYRDTELDVYIEFFGTRRSYDGTDWEGYREVKPAQKIVNYFEPANK